MRIQALITAAAVLVACSDPAVVATGVDAGDAGTDTSTPPDTGVDTGVPGTADFQILDISDWHGQLDPVTEADSMGENQAYGGLGVLSAYFAKDRMENANTLVFTAGDAFGGTPPLSGMFDDEPAVKGLNLLGLTADTFGNHNFDSGTLKLQTLIGLANYTYVSTNLTNVTAELGAKVVTPFAMFEVGTGTPKVKVAVLGITNPDAPQLVFPGRLGTLKVEDPATAANKAALAARAAGANVVIALAHLGATGADAQLNPTGPLLDLANTLQGVDVLLGDHTDQKVNTTVNGMLVAENRSKGRTYLKIKMSVVKGKTVSKTAQIIDPIGNQTAHLTGCDAAQCTCPTIACPDVTYTCTNGKCVKPMITPDPAAVALLAPYRAQLSAKLDAKIGTIATTFLRNGVLERTQEVPLGDLIADALLAKYKSSDNAQIVFINGGGIRAPLPSSYAPADLTMHRPLVPYNTTAPFDLVVGDIYAILPFGNDCVVRKISGQLLWQVLEKAVYTQPAPYGGFLQIAGFTYTYKVNGAAPGSRVQSVKLGGITDIPSNDPTLYTIVTSDFTNAGGDGYTMLVEKAPTAGREVMADVFLEYVKANTPVAVPSNPRITLIP